MTDLSMPYSLIVIYDGEEKTYPIMDGSFSLQMKAGTKGKHSASSCQLSVRGSSILPDIMMRDSLLDAYVKDKDGNVLFTGVIRPYASVTAEPMFLGNLSLEIMDYTEKLHGKKVYAEITEESGDSPVYGEGVVFEDRWNNFYICNPSDKEHSIVHKICSLAGISDIDAPLIDIILPRFSLEKSSYLDDVLGKLLYEYVYDYRFDATGKLHVYQTGTITEVSFDSDGNAIENATVYHKLENKKTLSIFRNQLSVSRDDNDTDGCLITYKKYKREYNVPIGTYTVEGNTGFISGSIQLAPASTEIKWDLSEIKDDDDGLDIELSNFSVNGYNNSVWAATCGSYMTTVTDCTQEGGTLNYQIWFFGGLFGQYRYTMDVYADVTYYKQDSRTVGYAGDNAEEYSAEYIDNVADALCLATAIQERNTQGSYSYSFRSFEEIEPGDVVTLDEAVISGLHAVCRITKRTQSDDTGLFQYEAEGYESTEFKLPQINRDDDTGSHGENIGTILLQVSDEIIFPDDNTLTIYAEASGLLFSRFDATPQWLLNGVPMTGYSSTSIQFSIGMLSPGANRLRVQAVYEGETYYSDRVINLISSEIDIQMQFALVPSGQSPDSSTVWLDDQPVPGQGEVVWIRFRTSTSSDWIIMKMTAEDGGNPVVFFQWAATPYIKPDDAYELLTWDDMAITWETDGDVMGFILDSGRWETMVPEKPFGLNYLWVKYWNYTTEQWDYFCTTGTPAMSFDLIVNPQTFKLTSRGVVKADEKQPDGCQRITVRCQRYNTTAPISWTVEPQDETLLKWERVVDADDSEIRIILNPMVILQSVSVHCSIADIDVAKDFLISGVQEGKADTMYLGIYDSTATLPVDTTEGALMVGDHLLIQQPDGSRVPYYYTGIEGSEWVMADANTPAEHAWKIMQDTIYDALNGDTVSQSESVINLYAANFAAVNAFIQNLCAQQLRIMNVLYGGGYTPEGKNPDNLPGFHLDANTGIAQITKGVFSDVKVSSRSANGVIIMETLDSDDRETFTFNGETPLYFKGMIPHNSEVSIGEETVPCSSAPVTTVYYDDGSTGKASSVWGKHSVQKSTSYSFTIVKDAEYAFKKNTSADDGYIVRYWVYKNDSLIISIDDAGNDETPEASYCLKNCSFSVQSGDKLRIIIDMTWPFCTASLYLYEIVNLQSNPFISQDIDSSDLGNVLAVTAEEADGKFPYVIGYLAPHTANGNYYYTDYEYRFSNKSSPVYQYLLEPTGFKQAVLDFFRPGERYPIDSGTMTFASQSYTVGGAELSDDSSEFTVYDIGEKEIISLSLREDDDISPTMSFPVIVGNGRLAINTLVGVKEDSSIGTAVDYIPYAYIDHMKANDLDATFNSESFGKSSNVSAGKPAVVVKKEYLHFDASTYVPNSGSGGTATECTGLVRVYSDGFAEIFFSIREIKTDYVFEISMDSDDDPDLNFSCEYVMATPTSPSGFSGSLSGSHHFPAIAVTNNYSSLWVFNDEATGGVDLHCIGHASV